MFININICTYLPKINYKILNNNNNNIIIWIHNINVLGERQLFALYIFKVISKTIFDFFLIDLLL